MTYGRPPSDPNKKYGALFANEEKKSDKSPDYTGNLEIGDEVLQYAMAQYKSTGVFKVRLIGYKKVGRDSSKPYLGLTAVKDEPYQPRGGFSGPRRKSEASDEIPWK